MVDAHTSLIDQTRWERLCITNTTFWVVRYIL